jgi:hypothetical protein
MMEHQARKTRMFSYTKLIEFYQDLALDLRKLIVECPFGGICSRPGLDSHQLAP